MALTDEDRKEIERIVDARLKAAPRGGQARTPRPAQKSAPADFPEGQMMGTCPSCGDGQVKSAKTKAGKVYFECSERRWKDPATCQFVHWDDLESLNEKIAASAPPATETAPAPATPAKAAPTAKPAAAKAQPGSVNPDKVRLAAKVINQLNSMTEADRTALLSSFGAPEGTSYVVYIYGLDAEMLAGLDAALA